MILKDKTAVITGASRGIGEAIVKRFLQEGAMVFALSRNVVPLINTVLKLQNECNSTNIMYFPCDVSNEEQVKNFFDFVQRSLKKKIDILVNAAAIAEPYAPIFEAQFSNWKKVYETNIFGAFLMMSHAIPIMRGNGYGKIINFSGKDGPIPGFSAYNSSKAGLVRLTETIAEEVRHFKIDVNIVGPGPVKTKLFTEMFRQSGQTPPPTVNIEKGVELSLFLASEKSNGLSGKFISAVWDNWQKIPENLNSIMSSDAFTLRRKKIEL